MIGGRWTRQDFAKRLAQERSLRGLTTAALAQLVGMSQQAISTYSNPSDDHGRMPPLDVARRLATALRVPIDWLWPEVPSGISPYSPEAGIVEALEQSLAVLLSNPATKEEAERIAEALQRIRVQRPTYYAAVEVIDAATADRKTIVVLELPATATRVIGIDDGQTIYIVDLDGKTGTHYVHYSPPTVQLSTAQRGAYGRLLARIER